MPHQCCSTSHDISYRLYLHPQDSEVLYAQRKLASALSAAVERYGLASWTLNVRKIYLPDQWILEGTCTAQNCITTCSTYHRIVDKLDACGLLNSSSAPEFWLVPGNDLGELTEFRIHYLASLFQEAIMPETTTA